MRILIVDTDPVIRRRLQRILHAQGYDVYTNGSGEQAWQCCQELYFDIILTAWHLPGLAGVELIKNIRSRQKSGFTYIILLTISGARSNAIKALNAGANDYINQPLDVDELIAKIGAGERLVKLERELALKNRELSLVNQKMQGDLQAAAAIQRSLLPTREPALQNVSVEWRFRPCAELAGDSLNVVRLDEEHFAFYMIDVSGHGVQAALLAVTLSRILSPSMDDFAVLKVRQQKAPFYRLRSPAEVCEMLNARFPLDPQTGQYFTLLYAIFNMRNGLLQYSCAGHPPLLLLPKTGAAEFSDLGDLPVGFKPGHHFQQTSLQLSPGDRIILYSDGVSECENSEGKSFGTAGIAEAISNGRGAPSLLDRIIEALDHWRDGRPAIDDISLLTTHWLPSEPAQS